MLFARVYTHTQNTLIGAGHRGMPRQRCTHCTEEISAGLFSEASFSKQVSHYVTWGKDRRGALGILGAVKVLGGGAAEGADTPFTPPTAVLPTPHRVLCSPWCPQVWSTAGQIVPENECPVPDKEGRSAEVSWPCGAGGQEVGSGCPLSNLVSWLCLPSDWASPP